jgi:hypothetical protein
VTESAIRNGRAAALEWISLEPFIFDDVRYTVKTGLLHCRRQIGRSAADLIYYAKGMDTDLL